MSELPVVVVVEWSGQAMGDSEPAGQYEPVGQVTQLSPSL
jgi:hypothetical protein